MAGTEMLFSILNRLTVIGLLARKELLMMPIALRFAGWTHASVDPG
jgi:hypothetical protein